MRNSKFAVFYRWATPYVQVVGWFVIAAPIIISVCFYVFTTVSYGKDIEDLKKYKIESTATVQKLSDKLEDIMEFWHIPHRRSKP